MSGEPEGRTPDFRQARWPTPLLFERRDVDAHDAYVPVPADLPEAADLVPASLARERVGLPTLSATDVTRHFTRLSQKTVGVDTSFYPLGSCTMKLNPKLHDEIATLPESADVHPLLAERYAQGSLAVIHQLEEVLKEVSGMDAVTLQPAAGAQGEWVAMRITRAYFADKGETQRNEVIVPDNAHGTNPASAALAGFKVVEIPSNPEGGVDLAALEAALSERTAAFMITNPSTLGIFEENIRKIAEMVHAHGALLYYDGANLNAIMGVTNPGVMGFDMVHFNLHKTMTIPHGGGGPGSGPVGVKKHLAAYLPAPVVVKNEDGTFHADYAREKSIGKVKGFHGNFMGYVRSLVYAKTMGGDGLTAAAKRAVLNANYLKHRLEGHYDLPFNRRCKHEFVLSAGNLKRATGVRAVDVAKRLLDYGYHAPTVYFPLIVDEAIMIEPTETESKETLDRFAEAMIHIATEDPDTVKSAPHHTSVARVDEVRAAREPRLTFDMQPRTAKGKVPDNPGARQC